MTLMFYTADCDGIYNKAIAAGLKACASLPTSSMATAWQASKTPSGSSGTSRRTSRCVGRRDEGGDGGAGIVTVAEFRRLALSLPGAEERSHMNHPDFRVGGKIFATLGYPDASRGMVKLFPDQQAEFVAADPKSFAPVNGVGRTGCTLCC